MKAKKLLSLLLVFVLAVSLVSTAFAAGTEKTFSDVDSTHWAKEFVDRLVAAGAADGYPDGAFKPSQYITRVEFMKLLNGVCGFTAKSDDVAKYTDVQAPWKVEQVAIALAAGYTNGTGVVTMSPNANITREMAVTMIGRAVKLDSKAADVSVLEKYSDAEKISAYAEGYMAEMTAKDLLAGYPDGTVRPQGLLTRAEAAKLLCAAMDLLNPSEEPTEAPVIEPTAAPTAEPTTAPTVEPTAAPTAAPTVAPTAAPTVRPLPPSEEDYDEEPEAESVFVLMNIPYADFYAAENAVDSISSATLNGKARNMNVNGASYHQSEAAVTTEGIAGVIFPVKVLPSALEGFKEVKDDDVITYEMNVRGTMTPFELKGPKALAENPDYSYYKLSEEPAGYKAMTVTDGKAAFGRVTATANVIEGAGGTVAYAAHHADLEIKTSGIEVDAADVSAVIVTTDSGAKYALHHVVNIWRGTEIGWNDTDLDLYGQTLTNLRFYLKDGTVNDYPVNIILKLHTEGASAVFADEKTVAVTGLPADIANPVATVKSVVGRGQTPVILAENIPVAEGKIALSDSPVDGTNYQVTIVSDNYADVSVTLGYNVGK